MFAEAPDVSIMLPIAGLCYHSSVSVVLPAIYKQPNF